MHIFEIDQRFFSQILFSKVGEQPLTKLKFIPPKKTNLHKFKNITNLHFTAKLSLNHTLVPKLKKNLNFNSSTLELF